MSEPSTSEPSMGEPKWEVVKEYEDITYKKTDGVARIAINRPRVRNAFRPKTPGGQHLVAQFGQRKHIQFVNILDRVEPAIHVAIKRGVAH